MNPMAFWIVGAAYLFLSLIAISLLPGFIAPAASAKKKTEREATLDLQNKVRQTVVQVCGAVGFLFTIFLAVNAQQSSNDDLRAKFQRETAELFVKAVESKSPEALYALGYIAQRDHENYHDMVFRVLASTVKSSSGDACGPEGAKRSDAQSRIQVAMQLLHDRKTADDGPAARFNIEHSCLTGLDLKVETSGWGTHNGLANLRMSGAQMLRVDLTKVELQQTELMGIEAGDWHNPGWTPQIAAMLHGPDADKALRRRFVAHFIDTNLTGAKFQGAGLEGADFAGAVMKGVVLTYANLSRANFAGAQDLTPEQVLDGCVGKSSEPQNRSSEQPRLDEDLLRRVRAIDNDGVKLCP
jgi:uncharacterized protein YjbI with pentapeptide repeats